MTTRVAKSRLIAGLIGVIVFGGTAASTVHVQKFRFRPYLHDPMYLPSGKFLDKIALGYEQMAADLVWFSAVQYYGDFRGDNHDLRYFEGLIDVVTTLDPHFIFAYVFGGMVVAEDNRQFERGMNIIKRGMARNPRSWELPFEIGFLNFVNRVDYGIAAHYFDLASKMPETPDRAKRFAAYVYSKAGDFQSSVRAWEEYRELTDNPFLKELAGRYIEKLKARSQSGGAPDVH